jgi:ribosome-associated protein
LKAVGAGETDRSQEVTNGIARRKDKVTEKLTKKVTKGARENLSAPDLAHRVARLALEKKGEAVTILDLRGLSSACDFFVLASGLSELQVKAMAEHIEETLSHEATRPWHVEGRHLRRWILIDYVDVVVHLFHRETREFYRLENLWADAPREDVVEMAMADGVAADPRAKPEPTPVPTDGAVSDAAPVSEGDGVPKKRSPRKTRKEE